MSFILDRLLIQAANEPYIIINKDNHPLKNMKEQLVEKLFHGRCTEAELETLFQLIQQDPSPPDLELTNRLWEEAQGYPKLKEEIYQRVFSRILSRIDPLEKKLETEDPKPGSIRSLKRAGRQNRWILPVAASVLLLIIAGGYWMQQNTKKTIVQTAFGERLTLELNDGSKVNLNANSQVAYRENWENENDREIWLDGEAFFEVEKKPETGQKLKVITSDLTVEVLGTTFNVNSKGGKTSVYLKEGQIRLYFNDLDSVMLIEPGDLIRYSRESREITLKSSERPDVHTSWKDGVLTFKNSRLQEVLQKIEDIYGITFQVPNAEDYTREVNFPLPINQLETTMDILRKTLHGLEIRKEGSIYIVE